MISQPSFCKKGLVFDASYFKPWKTKAPEIQACKTKPPQNASLQNLGPSKFKLANRGPSKFKLAKQRPLKIQACKTKASQKKESPIHFPVTHLFRLVVSLLIATVFGFQNYTLIFWIVNRKRGSREQKRRMKPTNKNCNLRNRKQQRIGRKVVSMRIDQ